MSEPPDPAPRLFTLGEARALLPTVRELLRDLQSARAALSDAQQQLAHLRGIRARANGHAGPDTDGDELAALARQAQDRLTRAVRGIAALGCELKDPERGMVDFRTLRDGRVVYLCWLQEEPDIMYWHELQGGYRGRQPL